MKYLMIEPGLCVQPTMERPSKESIAFYGCAVYNGKRFNYEEAMRLFNEHIASLPKLPTTCTLPAGEWFEGEEQHQVLPHGFGHTDFWTDCYWKEYDLKRPEEHRRKVIVPVEQKEEPKYEDGKQISHKQ